MKAARTFRWSLRVIASGVAIAIAMATPGCDSAPSGSVARLEQVFAERPAVADADNAFLDVFGFAGAAGVDDHAVVFIGPESRKYQRQAYPY